LSACVVVDIRFEDGGYTVVAGLNLGSSKNQRVCYVSMDRQDNVFTVDDTPSWIGSEAAACVVDDTLYAVGIGFEGNELWRWTSAPVAEWFQCEDMTSGRRRHCVSAVGSKLYVLGGWVEAVLSSVLSYNTETDKYSDAGKLCHAVMAAACVAYDGAIYIFGGLDTKGSAVDCVQKYCATTHGQCCTIVCSAMPIAGQLIKAVLWEKSAIVLGRSTGFMYDLEKHVWCENKNVKTDVSHFGLVLDGQTLYVIGGGTSEKDKDGNVIWKCTDEIKCISIRDLVASLSVVKGRGKSVVKREMITTL
jgi:Kelch motif